MSIGQLTGRATIEEGLSLSWGNCDRCGRLRNYSDLSWQREWSGFQLINLQLLVCRATNCLDIPNETLRAIVLPPDPIPIQNPRPGFYRQEEDSGSGGNSPAGALGILFTENGQPILTEDGQYLEIDD